MVGADEGCAFLDVGRLTPCFSAEIEQREIDDAVGHVYRGADLEILARDALEVEHVGIELRGLFEIFHADCKVAQTCHAYPPPGPQLSSPIIAPACFPLLPSIAN